MIPEQPDSQTVIRKEAGRPKSLLHSPPTGS